MAKTKDIFSFGIMLFEILSGRKPFTGTTDLQILQAIMNQSPRTLEGDIPTALRAIVQKALEKDPTDRYQTTKEMVVDLRRLLRPTPRQLLDEGLPSLAILPFVNASGDTEMEYLSDGITDSIIFSLSQLPGIQLMSRTAAFQYKGSSQQPLNIAQAFGVGAVLTGRVLQRGKLLVISAELVNAENGLQIWGAQYRRSAADIFAVETEIAQEISQKLQVKLTPEARGLLDKRYTENINAYHLYLKGRFYWGKMTDEGLSKASQYFRQAIELDPTYSLAYAGLAMSYGTIYFFCHVSPKVSIPKAAAAARRALEIEPRLSEARTMLGGIKAHYEWDLRGGEQELRTAIQLDPKNAWPHVILGEVLFMTNRPAEALEECRRAVELEPLSLIVNASMAGSYYSVGRYQDAIEWGSKTLEMEPNFFPAHFWSGMAYQMSGQFAEAIGAFQKARVLTNESTLMIACLGAAFAASKREREARDILAELEDVGHRQYVSKVSLAAIHACLGQTEEALTNLENAAEDRCIWLLYALTVDGRFDSLRDDVRFRQLIRRVGLL